MWQILLDFYNNAKELMLFFMLVIGFALGFFAQRELHKDEREAMKTFQSKCESLENELTTARADRDACVKRTDELKKERDALKIQNDELETQIELFEKRVSAWKSRATHGNNSDLSDAALDAFLKDLG